MRRNRSIFARRGRRNPPPTPPFSKGEGPIRDQRGILTSPLCKRGDRGGILTSPLCKRGDRGGILLFCLTLLVLACGHQGDQTPADPRPLFVYISPDPIGGNPFLAMGQTGIEAAAARHGARTLVLESDDPISRVENLRAAVDEGASLIVVLGFEFSDAVPPLARAHPDIDFLIVDQCVPDRPANVSCARFREHEAAFLLGATAALWTTNDHVGVIAAADIPFLHRYTDAYTLGARHYDPAIEVSVHWVGGENPFADPVRAKEQTLALAGTGANPIFAAAAGGNLGVFEAIRERDLGVFGLDINQCPDVPGHVIDNLIKRVDVAILDTVDALRIAADEGAAKGGHGVRDYGLDSGALGTLTTLGALEGSQCLLADRPEIATAIRDLAQQIIGGKITIVDPMRAASGLADPM